MTSVRNTADNLCRTTPSHEIFLIARDDLVVLVVVEDEQRRLREAAHRPAQAVEAAIDVAHQNDHIRIDGGKRDLAGMITMHIRQDMKSHRGRII
ncbi:MAG TPA: hypothetical protein VJ437_13955 [Acidiferrobacterales bacterium]|nr:hypothetical protein [Acidiferrobacterales bacterium]